MGGSSFWIDSWPELFSKDISVWCDSSKCVIVFSWLGWPKLVLKSWKSYDYSWFWKVIWFGSTWLKLSMSFSSTSSSFSSASLSSGAIASWIVEFLSSFSLSYAYRDDCLNLPGEPYCLILKLLFYSTYSRVGGGFGLFSISAHFSMCRSAAFLLNFLVQWGHSIISCWFVGILLANVRI